MFGEGQGRVIVSCAPEHASAVQTIADRYGVPCSDIGSVENADDHFRIRANDSGVEVDLETLTDRYFGALPGILDRAAGN